MWLASDKLKLHFCLYLAHNFVPNLIKFEENVIVVFWKKFPNELN